jgi:hypothetical protein
MPGPSGERDPAIPGSTGFRSGSMILGAMLWAACSFVCTGGKCDIGAGEARGDSGQGAPLSIVPGEDIQARVNAAPPGATFLLKPGLHRMQSIVPRNGDTFTGESGTVLSGARLLTTLVRSGSAWIAPGQMQLGRKAAGDAPCRDGYPRCNYPNDQPRSFGLRSAPVAGTDASRRRRVLCRPAFHVICDLRLV